MFCKDADTDFFSAHMILSQAAEAQHAEHIIGMCSLQPSLCGVDDFCYDGVCVIYELLKSIWLAKLIAFKT